MAEFRMTKKRIEELERKIEDVEAEKRQLTHSMTEMKLEVDAEKRKREEEVGEVRKRRDEQLAKKLREISEMEEKLCNEMNENTKLREELRLEKEEKRRLKNEVIQYKEEADDLSKNCERKMKEMNHKIAQLTDFKQLCEDILTGEAVDYTSVLNFIQLLSEGRHRMHAAVSLGVPRVVAHLRDDNPSVMNNLNKRGWTPFCLATARGDTRIMDQLWQSKKNPHMDPPLLHVAAANCQYEAAKYLEGCVNLKTLYRGATASQVARLMGDKILAKKISPKKLIFFRETPKHCNWTVEELDELHLFRASVGTRSANNLNSRFDETTSPILHGSSSLTRVPLLALDGEPTDAQSETSLNHAEAEEQKTTQEENTEMGARKRTHDGGETREERATRTSKRDRKEERQEEIQEKRKKERQEERQNERKEERQKAQEEVLGYDTFQDAKERKAESRGVIVPEAELAGPSLPPKQTQKIAKSSLPDGLHNLGSTCYMNCVIQCLYHTTPLAYRLINMQNDTRQGQVLRATAKVMTALHHQSSTLDSLSHLKRVAGQMDFEYQDFKQKEAHDFLSQMLMWLDAELPHQESEDSEENGKELSFISRLFHGAHLSTVTCEATEPKLDICKNEELLSNLSLTVTRPITLEEALTQYYQPQSLEWDCKRCGREHRCHHKITLMKAPPVLILHLNRSGASPNTESKLRVSYPSELEVQVNSGTTGSSVMYTLYALCCHHGSMNSGHYTAFCRRGEQWYDFNDIMVKPAALEDVLNKPSAHILFYEAKE